MLFFKSKKEIMQKQINELARENAELHEKLGAIERYARFVIDIECTCKKQAVCDWHLLLQIIEADVKNILYKP